MKVYRSGVRIFMTEILKKIFNLFCENKKIFTTIIMSVLSYVAIHFYNDYRFDFLGIFILVGIIIFFYKTNKNYSKRINKYSTISSFVLSLLISAGKILTKYLTLSPIMVFSTKNIILFLLMFVGFFLILKRIFQCYFSHMNKTKIFDDKREMKKKSFFAVWLIIFLCWIPYFIRYYPAIMSPDSYYVIHYANNFILSDLHTFGHTWFFGAFFHLGKLLFSDLNSAVAFSTIAQMLMLSLMFTICIKYLYKRGLNKHILLIIIGFYALLPLNGVYSVTLWRDVLFGGAIMTTCVYLMEYISNNYKLNVIQSIFLLFSILIILFFRNNGIYIVILLTPLIALFSKKNKIKSLVVGILIIFSYYVIKGPIFEYYGVASTKSVEAYSVPLQQIARTIVLDGEISKDDKKYLNKIMDVSRIKYEYKQYISDPIKNITDGEKISEELPAFLERWAILLIKNPQIYVESYLYQTLGYWYPNIEYGPTGFLTVNEIFIEEKEVGNVNLNENLFTTIIDYIISKKTPFSTLSWSIGLYFYIFIFSVICILYNRKQNVFMVTLPIWGLWFVIMIATPVFSELRYVYGMIISTPLIAMIPYLPESEKKEVRKVKQNESSNDNTSLQRRTKHRKNSKQNK